MSNPPFNPEALHAAAAKVYPHHWNGNLQNNLAQMSQFTPEQATESASRIRSEKLEEMGEHVTAYLSALNVKTLAALNRLPASSRVVIGDYYLELQTDAVDDGRWLDLGNGLRLDNETLQYLIDRYPAQLVHPEGKQ